MFPNQTSCVSDLPLSITTLHFPSPSCYYHPHLKIVTISCQSPPYHSPMSSDRPHAFMPSRPHTAYALLSFTVSIFRPNPSSHSAPGYHSAQPSASPKASPQQHDFIASHPPFPNLSLLLRHQPSSPDRVARDVSFKRHLAQVTPHIPTSRPLSSRCRRCPSAVRSPTMWQLHHGVLLFPRRIRHRSRRGC